MQSIISKGKTLQEAIDTGLYLLNVSRDEVNIEVIQQETKVFFGLKSKEAVVKMTKQLSHAFTPAYEKKAEGDVKEKTDAFQLLDQMIDVLPEIDRAPADSLQDTWKAELKKPLEQAPPNELAGKVWVQNGRLFCQSSPNKYPVVTIPEHVKLFRNRELVQEDTIIVSEQDFYEVTVAEEERDTVWEVKMDHNKLKVELYVKPGYRMTRSLVDIEPDSRIKLKVDEQKKVNNTLSYTDVMQVLEERRVKHGFHQAEIVRATETEESGLFTIATGIEPIPGQDGWLDIQIDMDSKKGPREIDHNRVDYREIKSIPNVESGQVIAVVHPPIPGQPGRTVTNEPLPAKQTHPIAVRAGKGIAIIENKVIATEPGRPHLEQRNHIAKFSIMSKLTHPGNVDLSSGNIRFKGDVEIMGEISERMKVEAEGDVMVHQSINRAHVTSNGAVIANGGIVASDISSGKNNMMITELGIALEPIQFDLKRINQLINQLILSPGFKASDFSRSGLQPLLHILLEKKFKHFPSLIKKYKEIIEQGEAYLIDPVWREMDEKLSRIFLTLSNDIVSIEQLKGILSQIDEMYEYSQLPVEPNSYIHTPNVLSSRLFCSGDVKIFGKSSVNTKIHAGGKLEISGALRGGEVFGRMGVKVKEAGAESNTPTFISVPADQQIQIDYVLEGTTIKVGTRKYMFSESRRYVTASLNHQNQISFV
ncbi:flagellar assembly protein A [Domibacillus enclensis]|uniref:RNA-binding protein KhpB N-terminal domain-containing protein n=1 Tax=Domibacillus enclensis TaxID=1017273 RepID=A0A1N7AAR9_9BACI|nr:FapA family protein [Domibacillus enclensis]OXS75755.1 hypothetical protein B1B05_14580 [Domibacillus enclensis]SIR36091.1 hypothetical protein SAMN05443094_107134 [Domibacillus enclensis]